jgi:hypothetical protein
MVAVMKDSLEIIKEIDSREIILKLFRIDNHILIGE